MPADLVPADDATAIVESVRARYAEAARAVIERTPEQAEALGSCCGPDGQPTLGSILYSDAELGELPDSAILASLGCGNPIAVAELRPGERVLDLGSGGGIDVILSARRVGPTGTAYGLDMTDEMLSLALANAADAGVRNVEFLKGRIEAIPLPGATIDVVISNCVINLAADKQAVFAEIGRVLRPGGRIGVSDIVARDDMSVDDRRQRGSYVGCIAGALSFAEYESGLRAAGLTDISIEPTRAVAEGMFSAIIRARKPAAGEAVPAAFVDRDAAGSRVLPVFEAADAADSCCDGDCGCG
ncbi:MAG TPA: arsenite methyltransferase [Candidatus Limnocylindrales bacterium]